MSLFTKRQQKIINVGNWRYYLKEKELSSVKVALSIEWRCNSYVYGTTMGKAKVWTQMITS